MTQYDYIIIGAGAAGLMLAEAMGKDTFFSEKSILLLDRDSKQANDRTWCFWERGEGRFDNILYKSWDYIYFAGKEYRERLSIAPYTYKMIRGIDFYQNFLTKIHSYPNIQFFHEKVTKIENRGNLVEIFTENTSYLATMVFNSMLDYGAMAKQKKYPILQQHFIGWFVKTKKPIFTADMATFMDFSIPQKGNTRFMYVLPMSRTEALVEYTLFSEKPLAEEKYEKAIEDYLRNVLGCMEYEIIEKEQGIIPMTCYDFNSHNSGNVMHIGTAGGWTKPSTGYTFMNASKNTVALVDCLKKGKPLSFFNVKKRHWYYDLLLLDILYEDNSRGRHIFETLFKNRNPQLILKFLNEETSLLEDLSIISACPKRDFIKAAISRIF